MAKNQKITECPHCGSKNGFYTLSDYIDVPFMYGFNGEEKDNTSMFDSVYKFKYHRYVYCIDCGGIIGTAYKLYKQIGVRV